MNIVPSILASEYDVYSNPIDFIIGKNKELLAIESQLNDETDPCMERSKEIADKSLKFICDIQDELISAQPMDIKLEKQLQGLLLQYSMIFIKCGDRDWSSFSSSNEIFEFSQTFTKSPTFLLSLDDLEDFKVTAEKMSYNFKCCQYNFARNLIYRDVSAPDDKSREPFARYLKDFGEKGFLNETAVAAANAKIAKELCEKSYSNEKGLDDDLLYITAKELNEFYKIFNEPEFYAILHEQAKILSAEKLVFFPTELREKLSLGS